MIAGCPRCGAKYRVDPSRIGPDGARLQCAKCSGIFRVQAPQAASGAPAPQFQPDPAPPQRQASAPAAAAQAPPAAPGAEGERTAAERERLVLLADADIEQAKATAAHLTDCGLEVIVVHDGVEAMLQIQRTLPRAVVLDAALPKMFGFQICEVVKRNESLRSIQVLLVASVHDPERYRRPPSELYGADAYLERQELPDGLVGALSRIGMPIAEAPQPPTAPPTPAVATPPVEAPPSPVSAPEEPGPVPEPAASAPSVEPNPAIDPGFSFEPDTEAQVPSPETPDVATSDPAPAEDPDGDLEFAIGDAGVDPQTQPNEPSIDTEFALGDEPLRPNQESAVETEVPSETAAPDPASDPSLSFAFEEGPDVSTPETPLVEEAPEPAAVESAPEEPADDDGLGEERAQAERLARIIVSDIVLYNPEKFAAAAATPDVVSIMEPDLAEARSLFAQRVDSRVRDERDFIGQELERVAKERMAR